MQALWLYGVLKDWFLGKFGLLFKLFVPTLRQERGRNSRLYREKKLVSGFMIAGVYLVSFIETI